MEKKLIIILSSIFGTIALAFLVFVIIGLTVQNNMNNEQRQYEVVSGDVKYAIPTDNGPAYLVGLSDAGRQKDTIVVPFEVEGEVIHGFTNLHVYDQDFTTAKTLYLASSTYQLNLLKIGKNSTVYACDYSIYDNILSTKSQLYTDKRTYQYILENYNDTSRVHLAPVVFEFTYKHRSYRYATSLEGGRIHDFPILSNDSEFTFVGWTINDELIDINSTFKSDNLLLDARFVETDAVGFTFNGDILVKCNLTDAKEIVIPTTAYRTTIRYIADEAFAGLTNLEKITIPETIEEIGDYAFQNDTNLKEIKFETRRNLSLGFGLFSNCTSLTSVVLPKNVYIGTNTFMNSSVKKLDIKDSSYSVIDQLIISGNTLVGVLEEREEYTLPVYVETIGEGAFAFNKTIKKINLSNVTMVNENAFYGSTLSEITCGDDTIFFKDSLTNTPFLNAQTDDLVIVGATLVKINSTKDTIVVPANIQAIICDTNPSNKKMIILDSIRFMRNIDLTSLDEVIVCPKKFEGNSIDGIFKDDVIIYVPSSYIKYYTNTDPYYYYNAFRSYVNNVKALDIVITYKEEGSSEEHTLNTTFGAYLYRSDIYNGKKLEYFLDDEGNKYYTGQTIPFYQDVTLTAVYGNVIYYGA